jgi:hypothetical protein
LRLLVERNFFPGQRDIMSQLSEGKVDMIALLVEKGLVTPGEWKDNGILYGGREKARYLLMKGVGRTRKMVSSAAWVHAHGFTNIRNPGGIPTEGFQQRDSNKGISA